MKKFSFSLEKVLSYNKMVYERERNELSRLRMELNELEEKLKANRLTLQEKCNMFTMRMSVGVNVDELRQHQYIKSQLEEQIKEYERLVQNKRFDVERQLQKVIQCDQDVKKMEKLKENQVEEYSKMEASETQEFILEQVSRKLSIKK